MQVSNLHDNQVSVIPKTQIEDSCNCCNKNTCCFPFRKAKKHKHHSHEHHGKVADKINQKVKIIGEKN